MNDIMCLQALSKPASYSHACMRAGSCVNPHHAGGISRAAVYARNKLWADADG